MGSHVLGLSASIYADANMTAYPERVEDDRIENWNRDKIDAFIGHLTASMHETFHVSGALADHLGQGSVIGGEYYGGLRYNPGPDRIITKVIAFQRMSGSGAVTTIDVQKKAAGALPTANESIFSNLVYKVNLSASAGNGAVVESSTLAGGSGSWRAGELIGVVLNAVTGVGSADLVVQIHWKPSGSGLFA